MAGIKFPKWRISRKALNRGILIDYYVGISIPKWRDIWTLPDEDIVTTSGEMPEKFKGEK